VCKQQGQAQHAVLTPLSAASYLHQRWSGVLLQVVGAAAPVRRVTAAGCHQWLLAGVLAGSAVVLCIFAVAQRV
jgi:hypothetical protein